MADGIPSDGTAPSATRVGKLLADERERLGISVEQAAEALRLRPSYVDSIEKSRLEDLPGATYAAGFVRAYAEFLGLDAVEVIRRFKEETETLTRRTALSFPSPVSEGRVPSRFILTASAVVAIFIYAVWHFFTSSERSVVDAVPPVPAQISQAAPETEAQDSTSGTPDGAASATPPAAGGVQGEVKSPANPQAESQAPRGTASADEQAHTRTVPSPNGNAPPAEPTTQAAGQAARSGTSSETGGIGGAPAMAGQDAQLASRRPAGSDSGESRIVVRANADSWIEVQDGDGSVLLRQILRAGESYRVPNRPGLSLMTGNAGGIEISVDGKPGRRMGPTGFVRRNIPLDPEQLLSGAIGD